jgi:hypothetical protein
MVDDRQVVGEHAVEVLDLEDEIIGSLLRSASRRWATFGICSYRAAEYDRGPRITTSTG